MKVSLLLLLAACLANTSSAFAETPKVAMKAGGFTVYQDGFATVDGDEYDPTSPYAAKMLDYLESIGEIESIPVNPLLNFSSDGCANRVRVIVKKSQQRMYVYLNCAATPTYTWKTSTGKDGHLTPNFDTVPSGRFGKQSNQSAKYPGGCSLGGQFFGNMSNAVYLAANGNYAIHGGCAEAKLGTRQSHGCVRIGVQQAVFFKNLVMSTVSTYGQSAVRITITN